MATPYNDNINVRAPKNIDDHVGIFDSGVWRAYNDTAECLSVNQFFRYVGQTFLIRKNGLNVEYWFKDGVTDVSLVEKTVSVDLSNYYTKSNLQIPGQSEVNWGNISDAPAFITGVNWDEIGGIQSDINVSGFTNDAGYITSAEVPIPTLQSVTDEGNTTSNAIQITGSDNVDLNTDGIFIGYGSGNGQIALLNEGAANGSISFQTTGTTIIYDESSSITLQSETIGTAGIRFGGRISGSNALNTTDFVTLQQLTSAIPTPLSFENGLREEDGVVKLGLDLTNQVDGLLTEDTYLVRGDLATEEAIYIAITESAGFAAQQLTDGKLWSLRSSSIGGVGIEYRDGSSRQSLYFGLEVSDQLILLDGINLKGLQYAADYSTIGTLDDRWIPDWGAVTNAIASAGLTFENGLREEDGVIKLGLDLTTVGTTNKGILTEPTYLLLGDVSAQKISGIVIDENIIELDVHPGEQYDYWQLYYDYTDKGGWIRKSLAENNIQEIAFVGNGNLFVITDSINNKGLQYITDYSAVGTSDPRWIPDYGATVAYADGRSIILAGDTEQTNTTLNAVYTTAKVGQIITQPETGNVYIKVTSSTWGFAPFTLL